MKHRGVPEVGAHARATYGLGDRSTDPVVDLFGSQCLSALPLP
jgi:hypothetical protein